MDQTKWLTCLPGQTDRICHYRSKGGDGSTSYLHNRLDAGKEKGFLLFKFLENRCREHKVETFMYVVGSKSFRPDIQKPRQTENAVRDI